MARFDLYRVDAWKVPMLVDVQADMLDDIGSRVVIPLRPIAESQAPILPRLTPILEIGKERYVLMTADIGSRPLHWLGKPVGNIHEHRDTITAAMDFLFQGF